MCTIELDYGVTEVGLADHERLRGRGMGGGFSV